MTMKVRPMKRILIIEDESEIRDIYTELLSDLYKVEFATDGRSGFRQAALETYDLIITDLNMPDWDGSEAVSALDLVRPGYKIIVASAYMNDPKYIEVLDTVPNIVARFAKPFDLHELRACIEDILADDVKEGEQNESC